jgi:putative transposase
VYHVLNRANGRSKIFKDQADYEAFDKVLAEAVARTEMRLLAYCVLPNHWHMIVWPRENAALSQFAGWLTLTHTQRWHARRRSAGSGHVYQGRFKSFPVQDDEHFYTVARYVERNALRANLVHRAEEWPWGSLHRWLRGSAEHQELLAAWPSPRKPNWVDRVNAPQTEAELRALRRSIERGSPFGDQAWTDQAVRRLGLESTLRPRGRPRKPENGS